MPYVPSFAATLGDSIYGTLYAESCHSGDRCQFGTQCWDGFCVAAITIRIIAAPDKKLK